MKRGNHIIWLLPLLCGGARAADISVAQREFFESRIRPVLAQECYECHSVAGKKKGGLLLDSRPGWQEGGETGAAIVPGKPSQSLLMTAIRRTQEDIAMPKNGAPLSKAVVADFERWIADGAPDPRDTPPTKDELAKATDWNAIRESRKAWWCFQPVKNPAVPTVKDAAWSSHPVDRFLEQRWEHDSLTPSGDADAATVLRRLSYVLTGLPPSVEELTTFRLDQIEATVDRMLSTPRYGEKWARHWMDWVRYAESYGSEGDPAIPYAWRYRDYLIRAFNQDVHYPQMLREAIAGDLLANPRINQELGINESAVGIAQLRMVLHGFSPTDSLDEMVNFTDNQIDTVSKAFQALTVSCARCHNHKFDAISQADFYAMYGIFTSTHPAVIDVNLPNADAALRSEMQGLKEQLRKVVGASWSAAAKALPARPVRGDDAPKATVLKRWDLRTEKWFGSGQGVQQGATKAGEFSVANDGDSVLSAVHPSGVFTDLLSTKDRGVLMSPRFKCEGGTLWLRATGAGGARVRYIVQNYPRTGTIHKAKEFKEAQDVGLGWHKLELDYWKGDEIFIQCTTSADMPVETKLDERSWFGITDVMITQGVEGPGGQSVGGDPAAAVSAWIAGTASDAQAELLDQLLKEGKLPNTLATIQAAAPLVQRYRELEGKLAMPTRVPGVLEADAKDAVIFAQGDHKRPGDVVPRRFLEAFDEKPFATTKSGRLEMAEELTAPTNTLTSRVIVNRLWHHVFGRGIVATTDNFGKLGSEPTHPELLDYLARRFDESGGSMKTMIRLLVTSRAFRLSPNASPAAQERDPENLTLSHFSVRRIEAEAIRDSLVSLSGKLDETPVGPSVDGKDPHRSVYVKVIRNGLEPFLTAFDAPVPSSTRGRRDATNVPAQSLALLNDPTVANWARDWASRTLENKELGTTEDRIGRMIAEAFGRASSTDEIEGAKKYMRDMKAESEVVAAELTEAEEAVKAAQQRVAAIKAPVRASLEKKQGKPVQDLRGLPEPIAEWDFEVDGRDLYSHLPLELKGGARVDNGALIVDGSKGFAASGSLPKTLTAKTLEAWVMLDHLDQRGGGVMTVQGKNGVLFDSIVFAEKTPAHWVAGSNFFERSELFEGEPETEAQKRPVHIAVTYAADGTITGYRDGKQYGRSYRKAATAVFDADQSQILFGCRHGSGGGNKMLSGQILRGRLYDRALTAAEVAKTSAIDASIVTDAAVVAALSTDQRRMLDGAELVLSDASQRLADLRQQSPDAAANAELTAWTSLAQAFINMKEFIYLR